MEIWKYGNMDMEETVIAYVKYRRAETLRVGQGLQDWRKVTYHSLTKHPLHRKYHFERK